MMVSSSFSFIGVEGINDENSTMMTILDLIRDASVLKIYLIRHNSVQ